MYRRRAEEPMEMIHAEKLIYEYDKRDEDGNVVGTNRAITAWILISRKDLLSRCWGITVPASLRWQNI